MIKINKILSHFNLRLEKISHNPKLMDLLSIIMKNKKIVYLAMGADILHEGHINIIKKIENYS